MIDILRSVTLLLLMLMPFSTINAQEDLTDKRVLLLYSYHPSFPSSQNILTGIREGFGSHAPVIDIEYMDSKRLNDQVSRQNYFDFLSYKLSNRSPYDVIIVSDDNALNFSMRYKEVLFPHSPIVFLGVNDIDLAKGLEQIPWVTGVIEAASFSETISLAHDLFPSRSNIYLIVDDRHTGQENLKEIQGLLDQFSALQFHQLSLQKLSWLELESEVKQLAKNDLILLISAYADRLKQEKSFSEGLAIINQASQVPIIHTWEHGIGEGILGGVTISFLEQGRQAADKAKRILSGTSPTQIPIMTESPNLATFDYNQLVKWNINFDQIPKDSQVLFQPVSLWLSYKNELIALLGGLIILMFSSIYLARKNYQMQAMSEELMEKSSFLRLLMDTLPDLIWIKNTKGVYLACNRRFEEFFGATEKEIYGKTDYDFVDKELADFFREKDKIALDKGSRSINEETVTFASDNHQEILETIKSPVYFGESNNLLGVLGVGRDITERKAAEEKLRLAASVFENTAEGVIITNANAEIIEVNKAFKTLTGYEREEVLGQTPKLFRSGMHDIDFYRALRESLDTKGVWSGEITNRKKDGTLFPVWQNISAVKDEDGKTVNYVSVFSDITQIKASQEKIHHLAYHDALTNLPNRRLLIEHLNHSIGHAKRNNLSFTVLYLDLDNFKYINDSFGHPEGDLLLKIVSSYLSDNLRAEDTVARVGGDEFVLVFEDTNEPQDAELLAQKVLSLLHQAIPLKHHEANVSASIGVCLYPQDGKDADELLRNADSAMYRAKNAGRNTFRFYTQELTANSQERLKLEGELRNAITNNELILHYQPQINLNTGRLEGLEALVRWLHPEHGLIGPDKFIPFSEENNLILSIGEWVLNTATQQAQDWLTSGIDIGRVAVNLSVKQIQKGDLVNLVESALTESGLPANRLTLEITETSIMDDEVSSLSTLNQLKDMGIELAIDDFGTGYSSLSYLKNLPIHKLKVDRSFVHGIPLDKDDMVICKTVIALGDSLNFKIVAEGVETAAQTEFLKKIGCHEAQGYLYSKPIPSEDFEALYKPEP